MPAVHARTAGCLLHSMCLFKHKRSLSLILTEVDFEFMMFQWSSVHCFLIKRKRHPDLILYGCTEYQWAWWVSIADVQLLCAGVQCPLTKSMCALKLHLRLNLLHRDPWTIVWLVLDGNVRSYWCQRGNGKHMYFVLYLRVVRSPHKWLIERRWKYCTVTLTYILLFGRWKSS